MATVLAQESKNRLRKCRQKIDNKLEAYLHVIPWDNIGLNDIILISSVVEQREKSVVDIKRNEVEELQDILVEWYSSQDLCKPLVLGGNLRVSDCVQEIAVSWLGLEQGRLLEQDEPQWVVH